MIQTTKSNQRGRTKIGWLDSFHSFSFGEWHDPNHMHWGTLRVINDDRVAPGAGFPTHPHHDMEIITYVLAGQLEHRDSMGNGSVIKAGDVQMMSAGSGVTHSEFNPSKDDEVHLLQIWIYPRLRGDRPRYDQRNYPAAEKHNRLRALVSGDGRDDSMTIGQDAAIYASIIDPGKSVSLPTPDGRRVWVHVVRGSVKVNGDSLSSGDGAGAVDEDHVTIEAVKDSEVLVFEV